MIKIFLSFSILFCISSCKGQTEKRQTDGIAANKESLELKKQSSCEALSLQQIATLMDIEESAIQQQDMSFGKSRSICQDGNQDGNRKLLIRMSWSSEKSIENKVLENKYSSYLINGDKEIKSYAQIEKQGSSQVLFGLGQDHEQKTIHTIRRRFGNAAELHIELTKESKDETAQSNLLSIIKSIQ